MLALEAAQAAILARIHPLTIEELAFSELAALAGRFAARPITAPHAVPAFDNSAMDGYAVRAEDLKAASAMAPVLLECAGEVPAGQAAAVPVRPGACIRLFTGSPLPAGADAVVMQEDVTRTGNQAEFREPIPPWENVRLRGEDVAAGAPILGEGAALPATALALAASCGCGALPVHRAPRVAIVATGSELRPPGTPLEAGQIHESNTFMLGALARAAGAVVTTHRNAIDTLAATAEALSGAIQSADLLITSGGVSVGEHDHVRSAIGALGGEVALWRVALKPGKPFMFGDVRGVPVFGLPGNPVSAFVTFLLLVRPAILRMLGARNCHLPTLPGTLQNRIANRGDRRHFVRVTLDMEGKVHTAGPQASHRLGALAGANGLVDIPPETTWEAGRVVSVRLWQLPEPATGSDFSGG